MRTRLGAGWLALGVIATAVRAGAWLNTGVQPEQPAPEFVTASDLLSALETADRGLRRLSAGVQYTKVFMPDGDTQMRVGSLYFASAPASEGAPAGTPDHRRFAVEFTKFYRGDRLEESPQTYAFDGQWLMEKHPAEKRFHLRQVVRPGETFDPLKIGQGPFPLPLGQKKDDILAEYEAELRPADDGLTLENPEDAPDAERARAAALIEFSKDCWQLRLTPRAGLGRDPEFSEVRLWYRRDRGHLLPRMALTEAATDSPEIAGDIAIVCLINPRVNDEAEEREDVFDVKRPDGWEGVVDELPKPGEPGAPRGR